MPVDEKTKSQSSSHNALTDSHRSREGRGETYGKSCEGPAHNASQPMALSLVIPAYNEERRLPASIRDIRTFFGRFGLQMEVLVIVEKSTDRTIELSKLAAGNDPMIHIIDNQVQRGKGYAVRSGMERATGEFIFFMDADLSTPLAEVLKFLAHFSDHADTQMIAGSRAMAKSQILKKQTWIRRNMGRSFNRFVQILGVPGISDTQCGFKAFRTKAAHEIFKRQKLDGFAFDVEVLILANRLGYKTDVLPVKWVNSVDSKVNIFLDPIKMLWDLIRIRRIVQKTLQAQPPALKAGSSHQPNS